MQKFNLLIFSITFNCLTVIAQQPKLGNTAISDLVKAMSLEDKAELLVGTGMPGWVGLTKLENPPEMKVPGSAGKNKAFVNYNIPEIILADGPAGLRIAPKRENDTQTYYATAFPVSTALASSWNSVLVEEVGKAIGEEAKEYGVDLLLAPGLNIQRNPLNGRNFEYYSEDPLVTGIMATAFVNGIQYHGVGATLKHFAANNQESNRFGVNEHISQRALREIYLKGFEYAVKNAQPWAIMTSYNKINGIYVSEDKALLTDILRGEWNFKGLVMTDWFGGYGSEDEVRANKVSNVAAQINAGNDWLMPGTPQQIHALISQAKHQQLSISSMDKSAERILFIIAKSLVFNKYKYTNKPDLKKHAEIARQAATESMVLLENKNNTLPIQLEGLKIALFGNTSYNFISGGTGSGDVNEAYTVSLMDGLENNKSILDQKLVEKYFPYIKREDSIQSERRKIEGGLSKYNRIKELVLTDEEIQLASTENDLAIFTLGRNAGESGDRPIEDFYLAEDEKNSIEKISQAFREKNKKFIIILNTGGVIDTKILKKNSDAVLLSWQPGQEAGDAVAELISGKANPSGKLAQSFPIEYTDVSSSKSFPGIPADKPLDSFYNEGIYVGYRYYETFKVPVSYPFGYGLSYSTFSFKNLVVENHAENREIIIHFVVENTSNINGKEVAQIYVEAPKGKLNKPKVELRAFSKTKVLQPRESQNFALNIPYYELSSYNSSTHYWELEKGKYTVHLGNSSQNLELHNFFEISDNLQLIQTGDFMNSTQIYDELKP